MKFVNTLNKPPLSYRLVIKDSARSNHIELATQQWRKFAPLILSTNHCEFYGACLCIHARKTIPLALIHPFTKQLISSLYQESLTSILKRFVSPVPLLRLINHFLPLKTFLRMRCFFLFLFHRTPFLWACGSLREPRKYFFKLSFYTFTLFSNNLLISQWSSAKLVPGLLPRMLYLSYYFHPKVNT